MAGIVINYRREDSASWAARLDELLTAEFGRDQVLRDIDTFQPGEDFVKIDKVMAECDVFIAVIGPQWKTITDKKGTRRLDNPMDLVRLEIVAALKRNARVIPVLVGEADMPSAEELPDDLSMLSRRYAVEIDDVRFREDVNHLFAKIRPLLSPLDPKTEAAVGPARSQEGHPPAGTKRRAAMLDAEARRGPTEQKLAHQPAAKRESNLQETQSQHTPAPKSKLDWSAKLDWGAGSLGPALFVLGLFYGETGSIA